MVGMTNMNRNRLSFISIARVSAMLMILSTHYLSFLEDNLFRRFLFGVPLFILLSGYVYSDKQIEGTKFLLGRFIRIMVPSYIYSVVVFIENIKRNIIVIINKFNLSVFNTSSIIILK